MATLLPPTSERKDRFSSGSGELAPEAQSEVGRKVHELTQEARRLGRDWAPFLLLEASFREHAEQWRRETGMDSSISKKVQHPAYQSIIALGEKALPLILRELRDRPAHWFSALKAIANESPLLPDEGTNPKRARAAWLKWGQERGLIE
jgi:hypothetical protein